MGDDGLVLTLNVPKAVMLKKSLTLTLNTYGADDFVSAPVEETPLPPASTTTDPDEPPSPGAQGLVEEMPVGKTKAPDYID